MTKVLVTGASGFIGTHLVAALTARGDEVTCLVRKSSRFGPLRRFDARKVYGDVTDRESLPAAVAGQQIIYHLADCVPITIVRPPIVIGEFDRLGFTVGATLLDRIRQTVEWYRRELVFQTRDDLGELGYPGKIANFVRIVP